jgi:hypothetical protein
MPQGAKHGNNNAAGHHLGHGRQDIMQSSVTNLHRGLGIVNLGLGGVNTAMAVQSGNVVQGVVGGLGMGVGAMGLANSFNKSVMKAHTADANAYAAKRR